MSYLLRFLKQWHFFGTESDKLKLCTIPLQNQLSTFINPTNNSQR